MVYQLHTGYKSNLKSLHNGHKNFTNPYTINPWPRPINKIHTKLNKLFHALTTNHSQQRIATQDLHPRPPLTSHLHIKNTNCNSGSIHYRSHTGGSQRHLRRGPKSHERSLFKSSK